MHMSDLQLSLAIIGAIVIVGVLLFNWIQQRRYRRSAEKVFEHKHDDVLFGGNAAKSSQSSQSSQSEHIDSQLEGDALRAASQVFADDTIVEAVPIEPPQIPTLYPEPGATGNVSPQATGSGDSTVDYVVTLQLDAPIAASELAEVLQRKFDFGKPVRWLGQRANVEAHASWEVITTEIKDGKGSYVGLRGCLQLADRSGPVTEVSLSEFRDMAQTFAARVHAAVDCPDIGEAHTQAVLLDQFCVEVDVMIGINIISKDGGAFTGTKIRALAEASGFKLESGGAFNYHDENGVVPFSLSNYEAAPFLADSMRTLTTHGVTFLLDVPRAPNGEKTFDQMTHLAGIFSTTLGGIMVDDNRVPLSDSGIGKIKLQLSGIQALMKARNIPAGSEIALRLFA